MAIRIMLVVIMMILYTRHCVLIGLLVPLQSLPVKYYLQEYQTTVYLSTQITLAYLNSGAGDEQL